MKLSVLIPVYNEVGTVDSLLRRVLSVEHGDLERELVVVDDASTDGTAEVLSEWAAHPQIVLGRHPRNRGKGAALRSALARASGDLFLIQDADEEYDPAEHPRLLAPILAGRADIVYGSRFIGGDSHRVLYFWHSVGNRVLTLLSNMCTNLNLTDMETCYKVFRREVAENLQLEEDRFGFEPEFTAKIARGGWRIYEVGISYAGRTYAEGKKIGWRDGVGALRCIVKYNLLRKKKYVQPS